MIDVSQTFQNSGILLIGANGFLGKVVLGLLLERYPEFAHLYILVRHKLGATARQRFDRDVLRSPALAAIAERRGARFLQEKITILSGDLSDAHCGIAPADRAALAGRVRLIVNCAGLVEFFPPVDESFRSNVDGVEHVVELSKQLGARLLHVSTCYVCGEADGLVEETTPLDGFYPRRRGPDDSIFNHAEEISYVRERVRQVYEAAAAEGLAPQSKEVAQRLVDLGRHRAETWGWVNIYTYAKSLGEQIIAAEPGLKYAIVRPAIVESALRFPFAGWVEGGRTAAPLVLMAMGGLKDWTVRPDAPLEIVPVDLIASAILIVGALLLADQHRPVYQLGTADVNPILLEPLVKLLHAEYRKASRKKLPGRVRILTAQEAKVRGDLLQTRMDRARSAINGLGKMLHQAGLPGKRPLADLGTSLRMLGLQASIREQTLELYQPFILDNCFVFESQNIRSAYGMLSEKDRERLPWIPEQIDWTSYWVENQIKGIERWVKPEALDQWSFKV